MTFGFLDTALQQFRLRPAGEPILESARAALVELADPMTVAPVAELYSLGQTNPQLSRSELEAWDHCTEQIIDAARERFAAAAGGRDRRRDSTNCTSAPWPAPSSPAAKPRWTSGSPAAAATSAPDPSPSCASS